MINNDKDNKLIDFEIELCNWMQEDYSREKPDFINVKMIFKDTSNFYHEPYELEFDYDEILTIDTIAYNLESEEKIKVVLRGKDMKLITFNSKVVEFEF